MNRKALEKVIESRQNYMAHRAGFIGDDGNIIYSSKYTPKEQGFYAGVLTGIDLALSILGFEAAVPNQYASTEELTAYLNERYARARITRLTTTYKTDVNKGHINNTAVEWIGECADGFQRFIAQQNRITDDIWLVQVWLVLDFINRAYTDADHAAFAREFAKSHPSHLQYQFTKAVDTDELLTAIRKDGIHG